MPFVKAQFKESYIMVHLYGCMKVRWQQHVTNETIRERTRKEALSVKVGRARLRWFGHINRMNNNRIAKQTIEWRPREGKRRTGRQRMSWKTTVERDLQIVDSTWVEARRQAQNRKGWKELCARLGKSRKRKKKIWVYSHRLLQIFCC